MKLDLSLKLKKLQGRSKKQKGAISKIKKNYDTNGTDHDLSPNKSIDVGKSKSKYERMKLIDFFS